MKNIFLFLILSSLFPLYNVGAFVENSDEYYVDEIAISNESGKNPFESKQIAMNNGKKVAFKQLLSERGMQEYYDSNISAEKIERMVTGIDLKEEKIFNKKYSAKMGVVFSKKMLREYLEPSYAVSNANNVDQNYTDISIIANNIEDLVEIKSKIKMLNIKILSLEKNMENIRIFGMNSNAEFPFLQQRFASYGLNLRQEEGKYYLYK